MKNSRLIRFALYCGVSKDDFGSIRAMLWERNTGALRVTSMLAGGMGVIFLVMNLLLRSGVWFPYVFLLCGSGIILLLLRLLRAGNGEKKLRSILICYAQMILVCVYAAILSTQESNYDTPATSVIVFISLLPLSIDDRPVRMYAVMLCETAGYLLLSFHFKSVRAFSLDMMNAVSFCVIGMVVYGIICARNIRELYQSAHVERIQRSIISSLAEIVEERDENTGGHILRTERYVEKLLLRMRESPDFSELTDAWCGNVVLASLTHDIGKIRVPDAILNKPGKLTDDEYGIIKKHTVFGGDIIRRTMTDVEEQEFCDIAYNIARHHHERYDGRGYPDGLRGEDIPLEARIMALADVYDALVSQRVYKKPLSRKEAARIIRAGSGTQFDPKLVPLFLACVKN
ncbi:MAG: HD domain-containing protein [Oscillospiraceae bacterium]|nr:HD domain-containing protein [Oscillospiraceae bacterium]